MMKDKRSMVLMLFIIIAALIGVAYFYLLNPKKEEVVTLETSVSSLEAEISSLDQQIIELQSFAQKEQENLYMLRKKLPDERYLDQLLLSIQEIELLTNTRVEDISFNNYDGVVSESGLGLSQESEETIVEEGQVEEAPTEEGAEGIASEGSSEEEIASEPAETPVSPIALEALPTNLRLITIGLEISAQDYDDLKLFLKELESTERVIRIDNISFELPGEEATFTTPEENLINASVQITTFYYKE